MSLFISALGPSLETFLKFKNSIGIQYNTSAQWCLKSLKEKKNIEDELVSFEAFTRDYVKEFIIWLKGQGASTRTINLRITSIRSFLKYCGQEDFELRGIYESVCQIQKLKEEKHPILYLQPEATAAILSAYDMNTQKHRRNRMILIRRSDGGRGSARRSTSSRTILKGNSTSGLRTPPTPMKNWRHGSRLKATRSVSQRSGAMRSAPHRRRSA